MAGYLFNTYTSLNGTAAETLSAYNALTLIGNKNSLIFDVKRKSIWAKGVEYGYQVSNITSDSLTTYLPGYTITASSSAGTNSSGSTYTYISGISFTQSKSGNTTAYTLNYTTGTFKIPAAATQTVTSINDSNKGSSNATGGTYSYIAAIDIVNTGSAYTLNYSYGKFTIPAAATQTVTSIDDSNKGSSNATGGTYSYIAAIDIVNSGSSYTLNYSYGKFTIPSGAAQTVSSITTITAPAPTTATPLNNTYSYISGVSITNSGGAYTLRYSYGTFEIPNLPSLSTITTAATNNVTLAWDTHHEFTSALTSSNTVNFTMPAAPSDGRKELMINFVTGATTPTINFPNTVVWENDIPLELVANAPYEVTISYDKVAAKYTAVWGLYGEAASSISGGGGGTSLTLYGGSAVSGQYVSGLSLSGNTLSVLRAALPEGGSGSGSGSGNIYYGYTYTVPGTATKLVYCPAYNGASEGDLLFTTFRHNSTSAVQLNINAQGAATVYKTDGTNTLTAATIGNTYAFWFKYTNSKWCLTHQLSLGGGSGGSGGSTVVWNQLTSTGTNIADITINGTTTHVYAPTSGGGGGGDAYTFTRSVTSGTKLGTFSYTGGSVDVYAPSDSNTWRNVYVNGTSVQGTGTRTGALRFVAGNDITLTYTSGTGITISSYASGGGGGGGNAYTFTRSQTSGTKIGTFSYTGGSVDVYAPSASTNSWRAIYVDGASWKANGTNTGYMDIVAGTGIVLSTNGNALTITSTGGGGGDTNVYNVSYVGTYSLVVGSSSSATSNASANTQDPWLNLIYTDDSNNKSVATAIQLYSNQSNGIVWNGSNRLTFTDQVGTGGDSSSWTLTNNGRSNVTGSSYAYISGINLNYSSGSYTLSYSYGVFRIPTIPTIPDVSISNGSAVSGKYISAISASGHTITVTKADLPTIPTIPDVSISNGAAETGKYISAISASGHSITVTKADLPTGGSGGSYAFTASASDGSYTFNLTGNGGSAGNAGTCSYAFVTHSTSGSNQIYNISVGSTVGSDAHTLYIVT